MILGWVISWLFWALPCSAEALSLNVQDAVKLALESNPDVQFNRQRVIEADQNIAYAYSQLFPTLSGLASFAGKKDAASSPVPAFGGKPYSSYLVQLQATQPLYVGGALTNAISFAKKDLEIRTKELEAQERDLTLQVLEAFYGALENQMLLDVLQQTKKVYEQTVSTTSHHYKLGRAQLIDVLQAKTQLALLVPQISRAENTMKSSAAQLATLLHQGQLKSLNLTGPLSYVDPVAVNSLISKQQELPQVKRSELLISQFDDKIQVTLAPNFPQVSAFGNIGRQTTDASQLVDDFATSWSVGVNLTIPLFSGLSSFRQRGLLNAQATQLEETHSKLLDTVAYTRVQAKRDLDVATTVLSSSKQASQYSEQSLKEAQKDFRLQTINYLQLLTSEQHSLEAESSFIQARYGYIDAVAKFFVANGIPIAELVSMLGKE